MIGGNKPFRGDNLINQYALLWRDEMEKNKLLREACKEAFLFLTAPPDSPRLSPIGRGNLTKLLEQALIAAGEKP